MQRLTFLFLSTTDWDALQFGSRQQYLEDVGLTCMQGSCHPKLLPRPTGHAKGSARTVGGSA